MAQNEILTERVRAALAHHPAVTEKKMFRGVAFLVDDKLCLSAGDDELMLQFDPAITDDVFKKPGVRPMIMKGRMLKGYAYVKEAELKTEMQLSYWITLALDYNPIAKGSKKKKPR